MCDGRKSKVRSGGCIQIHYWSWPGDGCSGCGEAGKKKERVQRSYFLDRDIDRALKRMSLEEDKNLTEAVNEILRNGLAKYL